MAISRDRLLKINVDASIVKGQNSFAIRMILRNHQGHYISEDTMRCAGSIPVMEVEMTGFFMGSGSGRW